MEKTKFEMLRQAGVTAEDALAYAGWVGTNRLPLRLKNWIPTPLPVVYIGPEGQFIRLPFLDLNKKNKIFGIAVGEMCCQRFVHDVHRHGFIGVCTLLSILRREIYPSEHSFVQHIFSAESVYARDFLVPDLDQMQKTYLQRHAFDATAQILRENSIACEMWNDGIFICRDDNNPEEFHRVVNFGSGTVEDYDAYNKNIKVRPMVLIKSRDPQYPVENGVFNWDVWRKECKCLYETT